MVNFLKYMYVGHTIYVRHGWGYCMRYTYIMVNMVNFLKSMYDIPSMYACRTWMLCKTEVYVLQIYGKYG